MDILYLLGSGSKWNNNELRYSLRSIEKFGKNVGKVYVIGNDPGFLSDKVNLIKCADIYDRKHKNMMYKITSAPIYSNIDDEFLVSSDDHFYVKETNFDNYPYYYRCMLPKTIKDSTKRNNYRKSLVATREALEKAGYTYYNFGWHGNFHVSKKGIELAEDIINESYESVYGYEPVCVILNVLHKTNPINPVSRKDLKIGDNITGVADVEKEIGDSECFSISDDSIDLGVADYLACMFPHKSKYEI